MNIKDYTFTLHRRGSEADVYELQDQDVATTVQYFGWMNPDGNWIINKLDMSGSPQTSRWVSGKTDYATAFAARAGLTYGYFNALFVNP